MNIIIHASYDKKGIQALAKALTKYKSEHHYTCNVRQEGDTALAKALTNYKSEHRYTCNVRQEGDTGPS